MIWEELTPDQLRILIRELNGQQDPANIARAKAVWGDLVDTGEVLVAGGGERYGIAAGSKFYWEMYPGSPTPYEPIYFAPLELGEERYRLTEFVVQVLPLGQGKGYFHLKKAEDGSWPCYQDIPEDLLPES